MVGLDHKCHDNTVNQQLAGIFRAKNGNPSSEPQFDAPFRHLVPGARKKPGETEGFTGPDVYFWQPHPLGAEGLRLRYYHMNSSPACIPW